MRSYLLCTLLAFCTAASAQYKCVDNAGKTTFQQSPCTGSEKEQKVRVFIGEPPSPPPAKPKELTPDQKILIGIERERRAEQRAQLLGSLESQINYLQSVIDKRNLQMNAELAALKAKKSYANNNLAGATWEQSISTEMQAVTSKYKTMNDVDFEKLRQLRAELDAAKSAR